MYIIHCLFFQAMKGISVKKITIMLKYAMITGGIVDLLMVLVFLTPYFRIVIFGETGVHHTPQYEWSMRLVASLGAAWTVLLFWAARKPFERKDILLFTVFPLMSGAYSATLAGLVTHALSVRFFVLFTMITVAHCPFFLYLWIKARKYDSDKIDKNKPHA